VLGGLHRLVPPHVRHSGNDLEFALPFLSLRQSYASTRWLSDTRTPAFDAAGIAAATRTTRTPLHVVSLTVDSARGVAAGGQLATVGVADGGLSDGGPGHTPDGTGAGYHWHGTLPALYPEWLGDRSFGEVHGVRLPYIAGEMAHGISSVEMVTAMARAGLLSLFGAGGLGPDRVRRAVAELAEALGNRPNWGVNLLHSPTEPAAEERTADILLAHRVPCVSLSAYLQLTPSAVRCAVAGIRRDSSGRIVRPRRVLAKLSRPEVAAQFLSPSPPELLRQLVERGQLTEQEAELAGYLPVAEDITVESDSGGHTDNRPLGVILPVIAALRDEAVRRHGYRRPVRVGAAGGLGSPSAVAAAFAAGADYVVTGSINQLAAESGTSPEARRMLSAAGVADMAMAPAADMFEMGVRVQVLGRGTLFPARAALLYQAYRDHSSLEELPPALRARLERDVFRAPLADIWSETVDFWTVRDPGELARAEQDPKHRMALLFRWYLGRSSAWANQGQPDRQADYQLWCGPAVGAFNVWRAGSFLDGDGGCSVVQIALNLMEGAAVLTRAQQLRSHGVPVPPAALRFTPRPLAYAEDGESPGSAESFGSAELFGSARSSANAGSFGSESFGNAESFGNPETFGNAGEFASLSNAGGTR
jgi:PfaD family protein